jgi:hypothetical protein
MNFFAAKYEKFSLFHGEGTWNFFSRSAFCNAKNLTVENWKLSIFQFFSHEEKSFPEQYGDTIKP